MLHIATCRVETQASSTEKNYRKSFHCQMCEERFFLYATLTQNILNAPRLKSPLLSRSIPKRLSVHLSRDLAPLGSMWFEAFFSKAKIVIEKEMRKMDQAAEASLEI